jgi:hypothetical protein
VLREGRRPTLTPTPTVADDRARARDGGFVCRVAASRRCSFGLWSRAF